MRIYPLRPVLQAPHSLATDVRQKLLFWRLMNTERYTPAQVRAAFKRTTGTIALAAKTLGYSRKLSGRISPAMPRCEPCSKTSARPSSTGRNEPSFKPSTEANDGPSCSHGHDWENR